MTVTPIISEHVSAMNEHDTSVHFFVEWLIEHWPGLILALSTIFGAVYWWMRKVFSTRDNTQECKIELLAAIKRHEEREREDLIQYRNDHATDMQILRNETGFVRRELAELKNLLIGYNKSTKS
jgi:hypothetical protein